MPTEEQLSSARASIERAEQLAGITASEIAKLKAAGRHTVASEMEKQLTKLRTEIRQLRLTYGI